ncbi:MAG TPA: hypothetical protein VNZ03_14865 [Terriglobales bacterium]|jgi:hypothetical protein|nr:hypothetical protein [Terriglobales bacterium]
MPPVNLNVHDISVLDTATFGPGGAQIAQRKVTFFVGDHGPFVLTYNKAEATADRIKSDIQAEVAGLQSIHSLEA